MHLHSNKAFLTFVKSQELFQTKQLHSFCCPSRLKWNHFCYSHQAEAQQISYSVRAESTATFSLPIGLKTCLKIHSVTKNWIRPASQIKILDLWQKALDGNSSALCSHSSGYLVASDGNYLQQKASVQFCMPCGVALLTLSFQKAEGGILLTQLFDIRRKKASTQKGYATFQVSSKGESDFKYIKLLWLLNICLDYLTSLE